jgi:hemin uptake protein HemP
MHPQPPSQSTNHGLYIPRPPRHRVSSADLVRGSRELIVLHEGKESILRITKTGKLVLTK